MLLSSLHVVLLRALLPKEIDSVTQANLQLGATRRPRRALSSTPQPSLPLSLFTVELGRFHT